MRHATDKQPPELQLMTEKPSPALPVSSVATPAQTAHNLHPLSMLADGGQSVSHYRILERLGVGGMGEVYLAEDSKLRRKVALKILPPERGDSPESCRRFQREARALAALNHPNIVTLYSLEEWRGARFITMDWVDGRTLREVLNTSGPL